MSYNAQQIYALAQYISFNQSAFPTIRIGNGIRHLEYNAQRGLDTQSYAFFEKMGTSVDKAVEAVSAHQYQLAHPKPTHAMPTSVPPEAPKRRGRATCCGGGIGLQRHQPAPDGRGR